MAELRVTLAGPAGAPLIPAATGVTERVTAYLKGRYLEPAHGESLQAAIECFTAAIAADAQCQGARGSGGRMPTLAVWAATAAGVMPKAKAMALQAARNRPDLAEACVTRARRFRIRLGVAGGEGHFTSARPRAGLRDGVPVVPWTAWCRAVASTRREPRSAGP